MQKNIIRLAVHHCELQTDFVVNKLLTFHLNCSFLTIKRGKKLHGMKNLNLTPPFFIFFNNFITFLILKNSFILLMV